MAYKKYARTCDEYGKGMNEGYCFDGGCEYYCSDECLHKHFTPEEWAEAYADGDGDSYWTTWDEDPDEYLVDDDDPAPNKLSVYVEEDDEGNVPGHDFQHLFACRNRDVGEMFRKQLRDRGLDPDK